MEFIKRWTMVVVGTALVAVAIDLFFEPYSLVTGGATGIGIILRSLMGVPVWLTNVAVNLPLFVCALFVFDKRFLVRACVAEVLLSLFLWLFEYFPTIESDIITAVIFGGIIYGAGIGLVLRCKATTGGSDLAAGIINRLKPSCRVSVTMLAIDVAVIVLGLALLGTVRAMYGIIAVAIMSRAVDFVLEGLNFAKAAFIVCDDGAKLGKAVMEGLERGVTVLPAGGMYSGKDKQVLMIAVSRKEIVALKEITARIEPSAFMFVTDIREIMGKF